MKYLTVAALAAGIFTTPALAAPAGLSCAAVTGTTINNEKVFLDLKAGDVISVEIIDNGIVQFEGTTDRSGDTLCNSTGCSFTAPSDGQFNAEEFYRNPANPNSSAKLFCGATPPVTPGGSGTSGGATAKTAASAAAATGGASAAAIGSAVSNAMNAANGGAATQVTQNGIFLSTKNLEQGFSIWSSLKATSFGGTLDGNGVELTFGADIEIVSGTRAGLLISYGDYDVTSGGTNFDNKGFSYGPYITSQITPSTRVDAYVTYGEPDYDTGALSYESDRVTGGLNVIHASTLGAHGFSAFGGLRGFSEDLPAVAGGADIEVLTASVGGRIDFATGSALQPYLSLAAEHHSFDDGLGTDSNSFAPRLGAGFTTMLGGGSFGFDVEAGEIYDGARDYSASVTYRMEF